MTLEEMLQEEREEGREEGRVELVLDFIKDKTITMEKGAEFLGISLELLEKQMDDYKNKSSK